MDYDTKRNNLKAFLDAELAPTFGVMYDPAFKDALTTQMTLNFLNAFGFDWDTDFDEFDFTYEGQWWVTLEPEDDKLYITVGVIDCSGMEDEALGVQVGRAEMDWGKFENYINTEVAE